MKKFYLLPALLALNAFYAQVPNSGFEHTLEDGFTLKNWGTFFPITVDVQPGEEPITQPSILFDNGFGFSMPVGDCLTGSWAMQISNAFDTQSNTVIPGKASLFNDAESPIATGWNNGVPLPEGSVVQFLGFDYKFFPMGNDVAVARLELFNENSQSVGIAEIEISQPVSDFQYVYVPIDFTLSDTPTFMTIDFFMQKGDSEVNSWSTLVVDNVVVNTMMLGVSENRNTQFSVYPTITETTLNIVANGATENVRVSIINLEGKKLHDQSMTLSGSAESIDVGQLAAGMYLLNVESSVGKSVTRFIKK